MSNALFGRTNRLLSGTLTAGAQDALLPVLNLREPEGAAALGWQTPAGVVSARQGAWFLLDTGDSASTWRAFVLSRTNLSPTARVRWRVGEASGVIEETPLLALDAAAPVPILPAGLAWTRAGSGIATRINAVGDMEEVAANTARIDHDPTTLEPLGALVEGSATNSIRNPRGEGTVVGVPGTAATYWAHAGTFGLVTSVHGWGVANGVRYVAIRCQGTVASGEGWATVFFETGSAIAAAVGQDWCASHLCRVDQVLAGPGPAEMQTILSALRSNFTIAESFSITHAAPTGARLTAQRRSGAAVFTASDVAYVRPVLRLLFAPGTHDVIVWVAAPQMERGLIPTSLILPPAAAPASVTRNTDTAAVSLGTPLAGSGTFYCSASVVSTSQVAPTNVVTMSLDDGTNNNIVRALIGVDSPIELKAVVYSGGVIQTAIPNRDAGPLGAAQRVAIGFAPNDIVVAGNGAVMGTDAAATTPTVNRMSIVGAAESVVYVRAMRAYATRLSDGQVLALSVSGSTTDPSVVSFDSGTVDAGVIAGFAQSVVTAPAHKAGRWCRCDIDDALNPDGFINIALAFAGPVDELSHNIGWGTALGRDRVGDTSVTRSGVEYRETRYVRRRWDISYDNIYGDELWPLMMAWIASTDDGGNALFIPDPESAHVSRETVLGIIEVLADVTWPVENVDYRALRARISERL